MHSNSLHKEIKEATSSYEGEFSLLIKNTSNLLRLVSDSIDNIDLTRKLRLKAFAVLGYFVLPNDLYPESTLGPIGYLDDVMALIFILKKIEKDYDISMLENLWPIENQLLHQILGEEFNALIKKESSLYNELIEYLDL